MTIKYLQEGKSRTKNGALKSRGINVIVHYCKNFPSRNRLKQPITEKWKNMIWSQTRNSKTDV